MIGARVHTYDKSSLDKYIQMVWLSFTYTNQWMHCPKYYNFTTNWNHILPIIYPVIVYVILLGFWCTEKLTFHLKKTVQKNLSYPEATFGKALPRTTPCVLDFLVFCYVDEGSAMYCYTKHQVYWKNQPLLHHNKTTWKEILTMSKVSGSTVCASRASSQKKRGEIH